MRAPLLRGRPRSGREGGEQDAGGDCARLADLVVEGPLPVQWEDEAEAIAEVARAGEQPARLAMFDLIRPSAPTGPAELPTDCVKLRALLSDDGVPEAAEDRLPGWVAALGAGDADACAAGLEDIAGAG